MCSAIIFKPFEFRGQKRGVEEIGIMEIFARASWLLTDFLVIYDALLKSSYNNRLQLFI